MSEGVKVVSENTTYVKVIFDTFLWKEHSVTHIKWDNLLMGKEVERKIVKNMSTIVTIIIIIIIIIITIIKKPVVKYFEV